MELVRSRPKVISEVHSLKKPINQNQQVKKIKQQVSTFIHDVQNQFSKILDKYEKQIEVLKSQTESLRQQNTKTGFYSSPKRSLMQTNAMSEKFTNSPLLPMNSKLLFRQFKDTAKSQFYKPTSNQILDLPKWQSAFQIKKIPSKFSSKHDIHNYFPINPQNNQDQNKQEQKLVFHRSKYQRRSETKKHHEEQIVHFLQQRNKNLVDTTNKLMVLIGKKQSQKQQQSQTSEEQSKINSNNHSKQTQLNQSLSQICDSLNNSFVAEKARKSKQKIKKAEEEQKKKRNQMEQKNQKIKKQRALKSLLCRLRQNANSTKQPQVVKGSKLMHTGRTSSVIKINSPVNVRKNSKVMINPVPVHQNPNIRRNDSPTSHKKNPAPILKNSSNILTRSISGISAISLMQ